MLAEGWVDGLWSTGAERGLVGYCSLSTPLLRRRFFEFSLSPDNVLDGCSMYWHLSRRSRQERHGSPGMSMWQRIFRDRQRVHAGTLCERYGRL
jgi:hypothetical protein